MQIKNINSGMRVSFETPHSNKNNCILKDALNNIFKLTKDKITKLDIFSPPTDYPRVHIYTNT